VKYLFSLVAVGALLMSISPAARAQTEVTILVPNPFRSAMDKVAPGFDGKSGYKLKVTYGRGLGTRDQAAKGDPFDVFIILPPYPEALASGNIDPKSATTLASLTLAVGVKKGAPKPDISSPKALKQTLLAAKTIAFVDPPQGSDGTTTKMALEKLGVYDAITPKAKLFPNSGNVGNTIAKGDAEICIYWLNEMTNPGVDVVGRLPKQILSPLKVVAFISTHAKDPKAAKALVAYLSSPEAENTYKQDGFLPAH
jgi:molybdate transport system substrate-binding protein